MKAPRRHQVRLTVFPGRERLPLFLGPDDVPMDYPALFITTQTRNAGKAVNTIGAPLSASNRPYAWSEKRGIHLEERLSRHDYFNAPELESLCASVGERQQVAASVGGFNRWLLPDSGEIAYRRQSASRQVSGKLSQEGIRVKWRNVKSFA